MAAQTGVIWSKLKPWILLFAGYALLIGFTLYVYRFLDVSLDRRILLRSNPDHYVPVLDQSMIFFTDFSVPLLARLLIAWQIGYFIGRKSAKRRRLVNLTFRALGVVLAVYVGGCGLYSDYEYKSVFAAVSFCYVAMYWLAGASFEYNDAETLRRWSQVFWLILLSVALTSGFAENFIKSTIARPRPLAEANSAWNGAIRQIHDEIVKGGYSYVSGHASSLFALVTPIFWAVRSRWVKAALFAWCAVHAWTRVYTAAHFPYCVIMGSLLGFAIGTLVFHLFWKHGTERPTLRFRPHSVS